MAKARKPAKAPSTPTQASGRTVAPRAAAGERPAGEPDPKLPAPGGRVSAPPGRARLPLGRRLGRPGPEPRKVSRSGRRGGSAWNDAVVKPMTMGVAMRNWASTIARRV